MRAVLAEQHVSEKLWSGAAARDRMRRRRRLHNGIAGPAREPLAHVHDDLPPRRYAFERFGRVLAELAERCAGEAGERFQALA